MTRFTACRRAPRRDTLTPTTPAKISSPLCFQVQNLLQHQVHVPAGVSGAAVAAWAVQPRASTAAQTPIHEAGTASSLPALSCLITPKIPGVHHLASPALEAFLNFAVLKAFYFQQGCKWRGGILQPPGDSAGHEPWGSGFRVRRERQRSHPPATSSSSST